MKLSWKINQIIKFSIEAALREKQNAILRQRDKCFSHFTEKKIEGEKGKNIFF